MTEVRLLKSDLPPQKRKPIQQAIQILYDRFFKGDKEKRNRNASRAELATGLKMSLDESFGPHWHVIVGDKTGFACKKRNETMAVWKIEENIVVMWQSPGYEEPGATTETPTGPPEDAKLGEAVKILEPATIEEDTELANVVSTLREELKGVEADPQQLAQRLRNRLTADFGPIWHVATGSDFVVEAAEGRRNHVLLSVGKTRIVCFQHEQFTQGVKIEWHKLLRSAPYLLLAIFCFAYMTLNNVCVEGAELNAFQKMIHSKFCTDNWEDNVHKVGMGAIVCLFAGRLVKSQGEKAARVKTTGVAAGVAATATSKAKPNAKESKKRK